ARWFSANGPKVVDGITPYVVRAQVLSDLSSLSIEQFLTQYAREAKISPRTKVTAEEFGSFLGQAFHAASFSSWLDEKLLLLNKEQFGPRNGEMMQRSPLRSLVGELYTSPEVSAFGATLINDNPLALSSAIKRFSNLHRGDKLEVNFR